MFNRIMILLAVFAIVGGCTKKSDLPENTLQYAIRGNVSGMDPAFRGDEFINEVISNIYDTLLQYNYFKRPLKLEPLLAASMPQVSKDGLVHTIKLKKGAKFQDSEVFPNGKGREITAQDYIYSWRRLADPKTKSEGWWIFDGKIVGFNEWRDKLIAGEANYDTPIEGLSTPDAETIVIKLKKPYYQLHYVLTMQFTSAVAKEAVEKYGPEFLNHPVGHGAYMLEKWTRGSKVVLKRNPNYHGTTYPTEGDPGDKEAGLLADAGKSLPFLDAIVIHEMPEDQPRWLNFMKGEFDYAGIPKDNFDGAMADRENMKPEFTAKGMKAVIFPYPDIVYIGFNMEDPIIGKNAALREALCYAFDEKGLIKKFYNDRAITAHSPIPPDFDGYDPKFALPCKTFDVAKAKELIKKAGYPDGKGLPELEYTFSQSTTGRQMAEYTQQQFAQIGVNLKLSGYSWPQFQDRLHAKKAQIFGAAWGADYPDSENMLQLLYGPNESPGSNNSNFKNKQYDVDYLAASKLPPGPARDKFYVDMRNIFAKELPWIPNAHRLGYYATHGWMVNFKPHKMIYGWQKYLKIDQAKKKDLKGKL